MYKNTLMWVVGFTPRKIGSFEDLIIRVAEKCKNKKLEFVVVFPGKPIEDLKQKLISFGVKIIKLKVKNRNNLIYIFKLANLIRRERVDILHAHFDLANFTTLWSIFISPRPLYFWHQRNFTGKRLPLIRRLIFKILSLKAKKVIAISSAIKGDLIDSGVREDKIKMIHNGIDIEKFNILSKSDPGVIKRLKKEFKIPDASFVIGAISQARSEKGLNYLIESFSEINKRYPQTKLLLVGAGEGYAYQDLKGLSERLGITDKVIFTEKRSDVSKILKIIDLVVIPSLLEGLSNSALEAMASGKAIVASRIGGLPEIIEDGKNGLLVPAKDINKLRDAIITLISSENLRKKFSEQARKTVVERFNIDKTVKEIFDLYRLE